MKHLGEMIVKNYFKLSIGHIALVGEIAQYENTFLRKCKAYLYVGDKKISSINIIGEDMFSGVNKDIWQKNRAVRTDDPIYETLKAIKNDQIKLIFYNI